MILPAAKVIKSLPEAGPPNIVTPVELATNLLLADASPTPSKNVSDVPNTTKSGSPSSALIVSPSESNTTCVSIASIASWAVLANADAALALVVASLAAVDIAFDCAALALLVASLDAVDIAFDCAALADAAAPAALSAAFESAKDADAVAPAPLAAAFVSAADADAAAPAAWAVEEPLIWRFKAAVIVILPSIAKLVPSQDNLLPKEKLLALSIKKGVLELPWVPAPLNNLLFSILMPPIEPLLAFICPDKNTFSAAKPKPGVFVIPTESPNAESGSPLKSPIRVLSL